MATSKNLKEKLNDKACKLVDKYIPILGLTKAYYKAAELTGISVPTVIRIYKAHLASSNNE